MSMGAQSRYLRGLWAEERQVHSVLYAQMMSVPLTTRLRGRDKLAATVIDSSHGLQTLGGCKSGCNSGAGRVLTRADAR